MRFHVKSKRYGETEILHNIAFDLPAGGITALLGPSGVGKTTLLRIIAGLDTVYEGAARGPERLGVVFQEPRLFPWLTASQNVALVCDNDVRKAENLLAAVGVAEAIGFFPRQLSLGMARRVAFARALAVTPELLLLDEPFSSLDETTATTMRELVGGLCRREGTTALIITHDPADVLALADKVLVLARRPATLSLNRDLTIPPPARTKALAAELSEAIRTASLAVLDHGA